MELAVAPPAPRQPVPAELPPLRTAPKVQTGAFGSAATPSTQLVAKPAAIHEVAMAGFDSGSTGSNGHSRTASVGGSVRTGGFEVASAGTGNRGGGGGTVSGGSSGFDIPAAAAPARHTSEAPSTSAATPVEITFKPRPAYTDEARTRGIEGEVLLAVRFCASGRIEVLRVVRGLGYGLDEAARSAAVQIRFRPGMRAGTPVDTEGVVHILFEHS
jgi:TonB family protein